jgi:uncharacterized protein YecT (DUF1311 family)
MGKFVIAFASFWFCCALGFAQNSAEYDACMNNAEAQNQITRCASDEAARADSDLNRAYRDVLAKVRGDRVATAKIIAFERAWVVYSRAYLNAMYPAEHKQSYGSMFPMEFDQLAAKLDREQAGVLKEMLQYWEETR